MPDICDLILQDHDRFRRHFAALDELHDSSRSETLAKVWRVLGDLLELHAVSEEELFYPRLLDRGEDAEDETQDAIKDHNEIRDGLRETKEHRVGTEEWWSAVAAVRNANSDHIAEEERGAIPDFRINAPIELREDLGARWLAFQADHENVHDVDRSDKDPERYIERHSEKTPPQARP